jgi:hypothetical protein
MATLAANNPNSQIALIRGFFDCKVTEMKALTANDRAQLASAIARDKGLTEEEVGWPFVAY